MSHGRRPHLTSSATPRAERISSSSHNVEQLGSISTSPFAAPLVFPTKPQSDILANRVGTRRRGEEGQVRAIAVLLLHHQYKNAHFPTCRRPRSCPPAPRPSISSTRHRSPTWPRGCTSRHQRFYPLHDTDAADAPREGG